MVRWPRGSCARWWRSACAAERTWSGDTGRSSVRGADSRSGAAKARPATADLAARNLARVSERYTRDRDPLRRRAASATALTLSAGLSPRSRRPRLRRRTALRRPLAVRGDRRDAARVRRRPGGSAARARVRPLSLDRDSRRFRGLGAGDSRRIARPRDLDDGDGARTGRAGLPRGDPTCSALRRSCLRDDRLQGR